MISDIRSDSRSGGHHGRVAADVDRATATAGGPMPMSTRCYVLLNFDSEVARLCPMSAKLATLRGCSALRSLQAEALR